MLLVPKAWASCAQHLVGEAVVHVPQCGRSPGAAQHMASSCGGCVVYHSPEANDARKWCTVRNLGLLAGHPLQCQKELNRFHSPNIAAATPRSWRLDLLLTFIPSRPVHSVCPSAWKLQLESWTRCAPSTALAVSNSPPPTICTTNHITLEAASIQYPPPCSP